ncbi:uncharacterized protein LOC111331284 [Stylophora pistillata]|uniref:uncharacterized protein LOC111331284 n=1 Tax=Stylophora pistillata TaxID=50429 RepID=UPI000C03A442|nr:uncharacterized protein LOC111331284 [Stylophora pistillata]
MLSNAFWKSMNSTPTTSVNKCCKDNTYKLKFYLFFSFFSRFRTVKEGEKGRFPRNDNRGTYFQDQSHETTGCIVSWLSKNPPPHPNKPGFTKPLVVIEHLKTLAESERGEDLSLRRFSPLDYSVKLSGFFKCPFKECNFKTDVGREMVTHQQEVSHPGWNRPDFNETDDYKP